MIDKVLGAPMFCTRFIRTDTKLDPKILNDETGNLIAQV
jgi:hypothetical protein